MLQYQMSEIGYALIWNINSYHLHTPGLITNGANFYQDICIEIFALNKSLIHLEFC